MAFLIGLDIGGTKCAVTLGRETGAGDPPEIVRKEQFPTGHAGPAPVLAAFADRVTRFLADAKIAPGDVRGIGVSCGNPMDAGRGLILSPPNLPGWDNVAVCAYFEERYGIPCHLQNDANACAVAEWKWGAGRGTSNMVFLTFGTGYGAGLILDGRLFRGAHDAAGEIGHVRLAPTGPIGYYKYGSAEGFCSGGGIRQLGVAAMRRAGQDSALWQACGGDENEMSARIVCDLCRAGDPDARGVIRLVSRRLGQSVALLCDLFDPEVFVLGGIYMRASDLLEKPILRALKREALNPCPVKAAGLGENIGDYAALSIATGVY